MEIKKYEVLTKDKYFSYKVKIALLLLNKEQAYEVIREEASEIIVYEGQPSAIFERVVGELLGQKLWYIPDDFKIWDKRFGNLFKTKYFCYDDDTKVWSDILHRYFVELDYMPKKENYKSTKQYNNAWGYFAELLAVVKANNHIEFEKYYDIAIQNGMSEEVFERKCEELSKIKEMFRMDC